MMLRNADVPMATMEIVERVKTVPDVWYPIVYSNLRALERGGVVERGASMPYSRHVFWQLTAAERAKSCNAEFEALVAEFEGGTS